MVLLLWVSGVADLILTAWGLSIPLYHEQNPIMARAYEVSPTGAVVAGILVTTLAVWILHVARKRVGWVNPVLWGLLGIRAFVLWVHWTHISLWIQATS